MGYVRRKGERKTKRTTNDGKKAMKGKDEEMRRAWSFVSEESDGSREYRWEGV